MKKSIITLFLSIFTIGIVFAQNFGVRAGANLAKITNDEADNSTIFAWQLGPFLDFEITEGIEINVAALYARKGTKSDLDDETANTDYLEFPAMARFHFESVFIQGGVYAAYLLSAEIEDEDIKDLLKDGDFGVMIGGGVTLGNIRVDARYSLGLADINDFGEEKLKHAVLTLGAEFVF